MVKMKVTSMRGIYLFYPKDRIGSIIIGTGQNSGNDEKYTFPPKKTKKTYKM
jgi:hypothetical protein